MNNKVYLAGPDVFRKNASQYFSYIKRLVSNVHFVGISPLDNQSDSSIEIYNSNIEMIKDCDTILANLEPFRGPSVDCGTAFEIGYAKALGKRVVGYYHGHIPTLRERTAIDSVNMVYPNIEDFGLTENLMIAHSCDYIAMSFVDAIMHLKEKNANK